MAQTPVPQPSYSVADFEHTLIVALEVSEKSWVVAAHVPGLPSSKPHRTLLPSTEALLATIDHFELVRPERAEAWIEWCWSMKQVIRGSGSRVGWRGMASRLS